MKLISFLSRFSAAGVVLFATALYFNVGALPVFAALLSTLVLLTVVSDYAPRRAIGTRALALAKRREVMPLAA